MKKIIAMALVLSVLCAFTGCGGSSEDTSSTEAASETTVSETTAAADTQADDSAEAAPAKALYAEFKKIMSDGGTHTTSEIAEALVNNEDIVPFAGATMEMEEGWFNGFTEDITGFKSAAFFGPMISSIPFVGYIFELEDGADAEAFRADLDSKADLAWNVCTQADEKICEAEGNMIFFVMAPASFDEE